MGTLKNGIFTIAAAGLLVGALLLLVPQHAGATQVHLDSAGIHQATISTDNNGTTSDEYSFIVAAHVAIPAGERVGLDYVRVLVGPASAHLSGGVLSPASCTAESTSSSGPRAQLVSVLGATPGLGPRTGYGYEVTVSGSGYSFVNAYSVDHGYGYGYGNDHQPTNVLLQLRVTGCVGPAGGAAPIPFGSPNPTLALKFQVFVGSDASAVLPSFPAQQTLFDPNFNPPGSNSGAPGLTAGPVSSSGGIHGVAFTLEDQDGDATDFEPTPAGSVLADVPFPAGLGGATGRAFTLRTLAPLPAGTQVLFRFQDEGPTQPKDNPPFGMNPGVLSGVLGANRVANYFQIQLSIPGEGLVDATGRISLDITLGIDPTYFATTPAVLPRNLRLRAFEDGGALEPVQPAILRVDGLVAGKQQVRFRITDFSSFVAFASPSVGGGGGGSPAPDTPATTSPPTPTVPGTGHVPADPSLGPDTDGDGIPDSVETALGSDPNNRASTPDYDLSSSLIVVPGPNGNVLTWAPQGKAIGYQIWASNSPWTLLATLDAGTTTFTDANGKDSTKYKVTYFVGNSTSEGRIAATPGQQADLGTLSGWNEGEYQSAAASDGSASQGGGVSFTLLFVVLGAALLAGLVVLAMRRRKA